MFQSSVNNGAPAVLQYSLELANSSYVNDALPTFVNQN